MVISISEILSSEYLVVNNNNKKNPQYNLSKDRGKK